MENVYRRLYTELQVGMPVDVRSLGMLVLVLTLIFRHFLRCAQVLVTTVYRVGACMFAESMMRLHARIDIMLRLALLPVIAGHATLAASS